MKCYRSPTCLIHRGCESTILPLRELWFFNQTAAVQAFSSGGPQFKSQCVSQGGGTIALVPAKTFSCRAAEGGGYSCTALSFCRWLLQVGFAPRDSATSERSLQYSVAPGDSEDSKAVKLALNSLRKCDLKSGAHPPGSPSSAMSNQGVAVRCCKNTNVNLPVFLNRCLD